MITAIQNWPNYRLNKVRQEHQRQKGQFLPGHSDKAGDVCDLYPIPIAYMQDLFQRDFWQIFVAQYGAEAIKPYPKLIFQRSTLLRTRADKTIEEKRINCFGADYIDYQESKGQIDEIMGGSALDVPASHMDTERSREAYRQCAVLERAVAWYWSRTGLHNPDT